VFKSVVATESLRNV